MPESSCGLLLKDALRQYYMLTHAGINCDGLRSQAYLPHGVVFPRVPVFGFRVDRLYSVLLGLLLPGLLLSGLLLLALLLEDLSVACLLPLALPGLSVCLLLPLALPELLFDGLPLCWPSACEPPCLFAALDAWACLTFSAHSLAISDR